MATRSELLRRLSLANKVREENRANKEHLKTRITTAPRAEREKPPKIDIPTNPSRDLIQQVVESAMIAGWDKAIQKHAYENDVSEDRLRKMLDDALEYQDKADPAGRVEGLEDWAHERRGRSTLASGRR